MASGKYLMLQAILLLLVSQQACGLVPVLGPRIEDGSKESLPNAVRQDYKYNSSKSKYEQKSNASWVPLHEGVANKYSSAEEEDDKDEGFVMHEPYKSLIQTSLRFALAQSSVVNYVQIDTVMDLMSDTGHILSRRMLKKATLVATMIAVSIMTLTLFVPNVYWKWISASWARSRGRLLEIERYLPNGLNEMGIISLLEQKTEEMLARLELNNRACRQQSVCQAGELLRCAFPRGAKSLVNFISEHFSRPRYRDHEYIGSFLKGFVDLNCAANTEMDQSRTCLSSYIKSMSSCKKLSNGSQAQPSYEPAPERGPPKYDILEVAGRSS